MKGSSFRQHSPEQGNTNGNTSHKAMQCVRFLMNINNAVIFKYIIKIKITIEKNLQI